MARGGSHEPLLTGHRIQFTESKLRVPDDPIIPSIEGDGTGPDIWVASVRVIEAAVEKTFGGRKRIVSTELLRCS